MNQIFKYYYQLFILYINIYFLNKHNIEKPILNKKLKFDGLLNSELCIISIIVFIFFNFIIIFSVSLINIKLEKENDLKLFLITYVFSYIITTIYYKYFVSINIKNYDENKFDNYTKDLFNRFVFNNDLKHLVTHKKLNQYIKDSNIIKFNNHLDKVNEYYILEKEKLINPKELKELNDFYNFKGIK